MVNRIAERQYGVISLDQLREAGLTRQIIWRRVRNGRFAPLHRGVDRVGPQLSKRADRMAPVLACGPQAVLSHRSAAALRELLPSPRPDRSSASMPIEVSVSRSHRGVAAPGILAHRVKTLGPEDRTTRRRIPVTTPARTLLDLASLVAPALGQAEARSPERRAK